MYSAILIVLHLRHRGVLFPWWPRTHGSSWAAWATCCRLTYREAAEQLSAEKEKGHQKNDSHTFQQEPMWSGASRGPATASTSRNRCGALPRGGLLQPPLAGTDAERCLEGAPLKAERGMLVCVSNSASEARACPT